MPSTSATSNPADVFRGLGYWYFYGADHTGPWTNAAVRYTQNVWLVGTSLAVPVVSLVAAAFVRWKERAFFLVLLFVGLVLSVGPFPFSNPTPLGGWLKSFMTDTTAGLALRSTDRATPAGAARPVHAARLRADRAVAAALVRGHRDLAGRRRPGRREHPLAVQRRHDRQQLHAAGHAARPTRWPPSTT